MDFFLVLTVLVALAVLAPLVGVDSRGLTDRSGGPPDLLPGDEDRHRARVSLPVPASPAARPAPARS